MLINKIQPNMNFKSNVTFDIGGSQSEGSCKIYYSSSKNEDLYKERTTVNDLGKTKFESNDDFIDLIVNKIKNLQKNGEEIVAEKGYPAKENTIKNVAIFLPSYTSKNYAFYLPNHRNINNKPLKDLSFRKLKEKLEAKGVKVDPNFKLKVLQDALGTGCAMAKKLYDMGKLEPGSYYTACITGGGCGVSNIRYYDDDNIIISSSGSAYLSQSLNSQKVSKVGASAPAVIVNFCKALGLNEEETEDIKACNKAEFTMTEATTYPKDVKTELLKQCLLNTDKFEIAHEDEKEFTIKIKNGHKALFDRARRNAIDKYCLAFARLAAIKKNEGSNGLIITGPLAKSIDHAAKINYGIGISEWITGHLAQSFNSYELEKMQKVYGFKVFCDDRFFIDDNTECKELVHVAEAVNEKRGNWLKLSANKLKNAKL